MVGVRKPVRVGAQPGHDRPLLEREHRVPRAGRDQQRLDLLRPLRVGNGVAPAVEHAQLRPTRCGEPGEEVGARERGGPELEVRRARPRERPAAEQGTAQVGAAAAGTGNNTAGWPLDRCQSPVEHTCLAEQLERARLSLDVELVAGRAVERLPAVGADLRMDA